MKAWPVAWSRPSARIASSSVDWLAASRASSSCRAAPRIRSVLPRVLQQPDDERVMEDVGPGEGPSSARSRRAAASRSASTRCSAAGCEHVGARPHVVDECELERARPRPELAHGQRRDRLEGGHEPLQPLGIEPAGTAADELERHRVDARRAGELVRGDDAEAAGRTNSADRAGCRGPRPRSDGSCRAAIRPPASAPRQPCRRPSA